MADRSALESAAAAGIIRADQIGPLYAFLATGGVSVAPPGEEELRFIRNFHDVFLAIGIVLFAIGLAVGIGSYAAGATSPQQGTLISGGLSLTAAVVMWALGELFARRRRLFLPAIAIVCALTLFVVVGAALLYTGALLGRTLELSGGSDGMPPEVRTGILIASACAFIAPAIFYLRFRLPFSMGLAGGGIAFFAIVAAFLFGGEPTIDYLPALYLTLGLLLFFAGVAFDARDPARVSRYSDNGFWLHFAAAPLVLGGSFGLVAQAFGAQGVEAIAGPGRLVATQDDTAVAQSALTLAVVIALGFVSLLINRRVLIVSALLTTGVAIGVILNQFGLGAGPLAASVLVVLGGFVLILGAGWHGVRRSLLGWVKPEGGWARIFPPESARE
ncbi:MAG TPA: hypothetical protein VEF55_07585 [Candidatus Binatia bacterium]|nr:hypothetical protein [Candidatus Binatia bacterium]